MSVQITLLFPFNSTRNSDEHLFPIKDMLIFDPEYELFGYILDMSAYSTDNIKIPKKPSMNVIQMTQEYKVFDTNNKTHIPDKDFYFCRSSEFKKIPKMETSYRNKAILAFLNESDPEAFVVIKVSW
jgi:hypothetical protein